MDMLALTNAALARLCIAATGVDPRERGQWLKDIAAKLEALCTEEVSFEAEDDRSPEARRKARDDGFPCNSGFKLRLPRANRGAACTGVFVSGHRQLGRGH